ncbi:UDP-galactopyranose mutase [Acidaminococcus sp. NSJ-142]|uniref:UDP-galactopyranose mutase n=1 Tax=Acidaminococcus hominis TaxID=2897706 RepID=UPI001E4F5D0C|nr:UDP-galactopyranose mutase [Acidaminococcus hominis]MCD2436458.1 UDP-galactopyranose mutase [Acidaminococcus hominis]
MYDYLIVGSGLFGSVFAHEMTKAGKRCLVLERRDHIGGNVYCEEREGIRIHKYGAHIFHTSDKGVWDYVNQFVEFNHYVNSPVANYKGELYNLPFNMNTFSKMWGVVTPAEAAAKIAAQREEAGISEPRNLEEQAISLIGTDIYTKLIKGYTEKQWGRSCTELPAFIIKRLPVRYTFDNNYFNDRYQGIPIGGYNVLIQGLLKGIEVRTGVDYNQERKAYEGVAKTVVYTGPVDAYFGYQLGRLEYRGLRFETERLEEVNHQGVAVMNYTDRETPYTRVIEHKHFEFGTQPVTYVTREYPAEWQPGEEAYYPVNDERNQKLYERYAELVRKEKGVIFGGRLAEYKYYDMDDVVERALRVVGAVGKLPGDVIRESSLSHLR